MPFNERKGGIGLWPVNEQLIVETHNNFDKI